MSGTADKHIQNSAIHMVSAFCAANLVVLEQVETDAKSNEITAISQLLKLLELKGCLVSFDAMGCQRKIATQIVQIDADYLLAVKGNQGRLYQSHEGCDLTEVHHYSDLSRAWLNCSSEQIRLDV